MDNQDTSPSQPAKPPHGGAFDFLRLSAALFVLLSHCYPLLGRDADEPLSRITRGGATFGEVAVYMFFSISGYLVTQSWLRDPSAERFMIRRALRIFPALAFVVIGSAFFIGPFMTGLGVCDYFLNRATYTYLAKILVYPAQYGLPGVFQHNPLPDVMNGSLWSLRLEFSLYIVIAFLGFLSLLRYRWVAIVLAAASLVMSVAVPVLLKDSPYFHLIIILFLNATPFFIGAALARGGLDSKPVWCVTILLALVTPVSVGTPFFMPLLIAMVPFVTLLIARHGKMDMGVLGGDYSYGIYLWAFPVQQCLIDFVPALQPIRLFCVAAPLTIFFAFLSWHLIEKYAIAIKPRRRAGISAS